MPKVEPLYQCNYAKVIKEAVHIPVIAVGLITTAHEGEKLLKEEYCDFVAYGRELLRNPNLALYAAKEADVPKQIPPSYLRAF
jgi:NADPH2 dehydrogenase